MVSQGAGQNFLGFRTASTLAGGTQQIPGGPADSMEAITLLGTNGGSIYGTGGAHPFENPAGFINVFDLLLVVVLPFAIVMMFGRMIGRRRQALALAAVMAAIFAGHTVVAMQAELHGNHLLPSSVSQAASGTSIGGNMEGKEARFGPSGSALTTVGTMGTTAGATDSALDSYTRPADRRVRRDPARRDQPRGRRRRTVRHPRPRPRVAVGVHRRPHGRVAPEFLGKKIRAPQMKLIVAYVLAIPVVVLVFGGLSLVISGTNSILNPGLHGLTEVTYAYASAAQNNGSAFAGLAANTTWYAITLGLSVMIGRFVPIILALAIARSLAGARRDFRL